MAIIPKYQSGNKFLQKQIGTQFIDGSYAEDTYHEYWLKNRQLQLLNNIDDENYNTTSKKEISELLNNITSRIERYSNQNNPDDYHMYDYGIPKILGLSREKLNDEGKYIPTEIVYNDYYKKEGVPEDIIIHERTHALKNNPYIYTPLEAKIASILKKRYNKEDIDIFGKYTLRPSEVYAGLMLLRYKLNLNPNYAVTLEDIKEWKEKNLLNRYLKDKDDDILLKLFNEVAYNPKLNLNYYAKKGGKLISKNTIKRFKLKFLFGGKYLYSYGYPVYFSNNAPPEYSWADRYLKEHPNVTGMAVGGGAQGPDDTGPRVIIRNSYSNIIKDPMDKRWEGLDKIEAVRHFMNETNYKPYFKISPELEFFRKTNFDKNAPYNTDDDAWRQSIISRIAGGDMQGTPEQMKEYHKFMTEFLKKKGFSILY